MVSRAAGQPHCRGFWYGLGIDSLISVSDIWRKVIDVDRVVVSTLRSCIISSLLMLTLEHVPPLGLREAHTCNDLCIMIRCRIIFTSSTQPSGKHFGLESVSDLAVFTQALQSLRGMMGIPKP